MVRDLATWWLTVDPTRLLTSSCSKESIIPLLPMVESRYEGFRDLIRWFMCRLQIVCGLSIRDALKKGLPQDLQLE